MRSITAITFIFTFLSVCFAQKDTVHAKGTNGDGAAQAPDAYYAGAGTGVLDGLDAEDWAYQFFGGKLWSLNRYFATKAIAEATTDFDKSVLASALIGANVYPVKGIVSPYIGAGAGLGYARAATEEDVFGLDLSGTFGLLMFPDAPLKVKFETNANFLLRELLSDKMPMTFTARVGVLF